MNRGRRSSVHSPPFSVPCTDRIRTTIRLRALAQCRRVPAGRSDPGLRGAAAVYRSSDRNWPPRRYGRATDHVCPHQRNDGQTQADPGDRRQHAQSLGRTARDGLCPAPQPWRLSRPGARPGRSVARGFLARWHADRGGHRPHLPHHVRPDPCQVRPADRSVRDRGLRAALRRDGAVGRPACGYQCHCDSESPPASFACCTRSNRACPRSWRILWTAARGLPRSYRASARTLCRGIHCRPAPRHRLASQAQTRWAADHWRSLAKPLLGDDMAWRRMRRRGAPRSTRGAPATGVAPGAREQPAGQRGK